MPRKIDHEDRRRRIADAVCALIGRRGLEGVSLREVAGEAGVSMGAVQRCFSTKEDMLVFAQEHVNRRITERAQARIAGSTSPIRMLAETLTAMLAADDLVEARVWMAFTAQSAVDPALAEVQRGHYAGLAELLAVLLRAAQDAGQVRAGLDVAAEVETLITLADGLTVQILLGRRTVASAREQLHTRLDGLRTA
ncbi:TetR/AcrR family transcriptional regulator [Amycolatopsis thermalba]|uniref:TetR/AcrR family transcriptional regulator n=1 Tax=Amycolatopsis thermalba TaxID=944492 RepID=A0ABY4P5H0_9PSEU|nr:MULTISPECIES: TetR/AcrR family transcriptional regulator [Amycolatopsis]UQS27513.1 TetR/AcrR family transcriptional regulator [Amycolatopsis thermalba]